MCKYCMYFRFRIFFWSLILPPLVQPNPTSLFQSQPQLDRHLFFIRQATTLPCPVKPVMFCFALPQRQSVLSGLPGFRDLPLNYRTGPRHEKPSRALCVICQYIIAGMGCPILRYLFWAGDELNLPRVCSRLLAGAGVLLLLLCFGSPPVPITLQELVSTLIHSEFPFLERAPKFHPRKISRPLAECVKLCVSAS